MTAAVTAATIDDIENTISLSLLTSGYHLTESRFGLLNGYVVPLDLFLIVMLKVSQSKSMAEIESSLSFFTNDNPIWETILVRKNSGKIIEIRGFIAEMVKFLTPIRSSADSRESVLEFYREFAEHYRYVMNGINANDD